MNDSCVWNFSDKMEIQLKFSHEQQSYRANIKHLKQWMLRNPVNYLIRPFCLFELT